MFLFLLKRFFFNSNYTVVLQNRNFPNSSKIQVKLNIKKKKSLNPWGSFMVMHGWRWICGHPRGCPSAAPLCKARLHSQMYPHATGCLVVPLAAKWKLIVFLWVRDIISTSARSFKKLSRSQYSWLQCQKIPFRKAPWHLYPEWKSWQFFFLATKVLFWKRSNLQEGCKKSTRK